MTHRISADRMYLPKHLTPEIKKLGLLPCVGFKLATIEVRLYRPRKDGLCVTGNHFSIYLNHFLHLSSLCIRYKQKPWDFDLF